MEKRISVDELSIGIFVAELDRPWIDTPFLLQGFLIQDEETLAQLRATCKHVVIDLYRSDTNLVGEVRRTPPARPARAQPAIVTVAAPSSAPSSEEKKSGRWLARMREGWKAFTEEVEAAQEAQPHATNVESTVRTSPALPPRPASPRAIQPAAAIDVAHAAEPRSVAPPAAPIRGLALPSPGDLLAWLRNGLILLRWSNPEADEDESDPAEADSTAAPSAVRVYRTSATLEQELAPATERFGRASEVLQRVVRDIRSGKGLEIEAVEEVVEDLVDSMVRNPDALQLVSSLRESDASAYSHALQVAVLLVAFGRELGFSKTELQHLGQVGMLLDIGKLGVRRELLDKRGNLTTLEFAAVKRHVEYGLEMLRSSRSGHPDVLAGIAQHHERVNGSGYPQGLRGEQICVFAQMAGIVDTFAALTSPRPYAEPISPYDAMRNLQGWSDSSFRGALVQQFIQAIGIFPVGSLVELSTGEAAIVIGQHKAHRLKPKLLIITAPDKTPLSVPASLDLLYAQGSAAGAPPYILRGLPVDASGVDLAEYYLSR